MVKVSRKHFLESMFEWYVSLKTRPSSCTFSALKTKQRIQGFCSQIQWWMSSGVEPSTWIKHDGQGQKEKKKRTTIETTSSTTLYFVWEGNLFLKWNKDSLWSVLLRAVYICGNKTFFCKKYNPVILVRKTWLLNSVWKTERSRNNVPLSSPPSRG